MIGLFFLVRDNKNHIVYISQSIIIVAALTATAIYHIFLKQAYNPLIKNVSVVLSNETFGNVPRGNCYVHDFTEVHGWIGRASEANQRIAVLADKGRLPYRRDLAYGYRRLLTATLIIYISLLTIVDNFLL